MAGPYEIEDIVNVVINLADRAITQQGFSTPLVVAEGALTGTTDAVVSVTKADDLIDYGVATTSYAYKAVQTILMGDRRPRQVKVALIDDMADIVDELISLRGIDDDWFYLIVDSVDDAIIEEVADYVESIQRFFVARTMTPAVWTSATTDIATKLKEKQLNYTLLFADDQPDNLLEAAFIGAVADFIPGSMTAHGLTLKGVLPTKFKRTEVNFVEAKNANIYTMIAGMGWMMDGFVPSGRFYDITVGAIYLKIRMQEDIFGFIKREADMGRKIPYTDIGVSQIVSVMYARTTQSIADGFLAESPAPKVMPPLVAEIPQNDRASRVLPNIPFEAYLAGAVHRVKITGYVSV